MAAAYDKPLEQKLLTEENIHRHREETNGFVKMMMEAAKERIEQLMAQVDVKEEMVTTRDGTQIELIIIKPKTLEPQNASAYFYAHGGGGATMTARH